MLARIRTHVFSASIMAVAVVCFVASWFELLGEGLGPEAIVPGLLAPVGLMAWPWMQRIGPLVTIWLMAIAVNFDAPISDGWLSSGALFWVAMIASAAGVSSSSRTRAVVQWVLYVLPSALSLMHTPNTSFVTELFWIGCLTAAVYLTARFVALYREQAVTLRAQQLLLEHEREEHGRLAAAEERARIARELHDVVAHSVSVMVMHAGGVRRLLREDQPEQRAALEALEDTGRTAMAEIRRALGVLRRPDEPAERAPQPGLHSLSQLVEQLRGTGLRITLSVEGEPTAAGHNVDIAAYRIAQEALTNVVKHAAGARVEVFVRYRDDAVEVEVCDDGGGGSTSEMPPGYGLVGLRERASVLGGSLDAGPRTGGGFRVHATLPLEAGA